jgi:hypothetical protein
LFGVKSKTTVQNSKATKKLSIFNLISVRALLWLIHPWIRYWVDHSLMFHFIIHFWVLQLNMLVQRSLCPVWLTAPFGLTPEFPFNFISSPSWTFLPFWRLPSDIVSEIFCLFLNYISPTSSLLSFSHANYLR